MDLPVADTDIVYEVGYIPFHAEATILFFQLITSPCERGSVIVPSNQPVSARGEIFGDAVVSAAMIYRLVVHAKILSLGGDFCRLKDKIVAEPAGRRAKVEATC